VLEIKRKVIELRNRVVTKDLLRSINQVTTSLSKARQKRVVNWWRKKDKIRDSHLVKWETIQEEGNQKQREKGIKEGPIIDNHRRDRGEKDLKHNSNRGYRNHYRKKSHLAMVYQ